MDLIRVAVVGIGGLCAECSDFVGMVVYKYGNCSVLYTCFDLLEFVQDRFDLIGRGVCANIPIMRQDTEDGIPDTAADNIGLEAGLV